MQRRRVLAWLGAAVVFATAVIALRETQPVGPLPAAPSPTTTGPNKVSRFAVDGVVLPGPGGRPAAPDFVQATRTGPRRLRVAWGTALPGGASPEHAVGYEVRWSSLATGAGGSRLVAASELELELDGLRNADDYAVEVRSVDAFGQRSTPTVASTGPDADRLWDPGRLTGLYEQFDGPFSVDSSEVSARWHLSGYPGCTAAATIGGMLAVDLECGADLAVLRARSPLRLTDDLHAERGRIVLVTDAAGPTGALTIDLVPGQTDRLGAGADPGPPPATPANATAVTDPALPDGTLRVRIDDGGARVLTGPAVPRLPPPSPTRSDAPTWAPTRGVGVLHVFEVVIDHGGLRVLQDGVLIAAVPVAAPWTQANLLIGIGGPPGRQARVRVDSIGFTGPATPPPPSYSHPVVPSTQRVLGRDEQAPGIGISRRQLATAAAARLVATVTTVPGVDLGGLVLQHGDVVIPARPLLASVPARPGAEVTVAAELPASLLGPDGGGAVSPLVLRAPGADTTSVPVVGSYLEIVPLPGHTVSPAATGSRTPRLPPPVALPRPSVRLLDSASEEEVSTAVPGTRLVVEVTLDGLGGQLDGARLAGVAGFQLWMDTRQIAGVPTAVDGAGVAGVYRVAISLRPLAAGAHFIELRLIAVDPTVKTISTLTSWQVS